MTLFLQVVAHAIEFGHRDEWSRIIASDDAGWAGRVIGRAGQVGVVHIAEELLATAGVTHADWGNRQSAAMRFAPAEVDAVVVLLHELPDWRHADPVLLGYAKAMARAGVHVEAWLPSWDAGLPLEYAVEIAAA